MKNLLVSVFQLVMSQAAVFFAHKAVVKARGYSCGPGNQKEICGRTGKCLEPLHGSLLSHYPPEPQDGHENCLCQTANRALSSHDF